jgi:hypothetical protein
MPGTDLGLQPERHQPTLVANLIDLQEFPESRREALPCSWDKFGTEINFFSGTFRPVSPKQFTELPCRIALTQSPSMPARGMKLAKSNENKFREIPPRWLAVVL